MAFPVEAISTYSTVVTAEGVIPLNTPRVELECPETPVSEEANEIGCSESQIREEYEVEEINALHYSIEMFNLKVITRRSQPLPFFLAVSGIHTKFSCANRDD